MLTEVTQIANVQEVHIPPWSGCMTSANKHISSTLRYSYTNLFILQIHQRIKNRLTLFNDCLVRLA